METRMMMNAIFASLISMNLFACASKSDRTPASEAKPEYTKIKSQRKPQNVKPEEVETSQPEPAGCQSAVLMSVEDRIFVIEKVVSESEKEVGQLSDQLLPNDVHARLGTFSAGQLDDDVSFVSLDRTCWVDFYDARQRLKERDEAGAAKASNSWEACLRATFPERIEIAKPYFSCFNGRTLKKTKIKAK